MPKLRLYQVEAVKDLLEKQNILIADDMGLGKTAEALAGKTAIENRQGYESPTFIACPASVMTHWESEARKWYKKKDDTHIVRVESGTFDSDIKRAAQTSPDLVVVGYPTLSYYGTDTQKMKALRKIGFNYGILDEGHNARNPESIRSGAVRDLIHSMPYRAILTGTPIPNTVIDIYSLLNLLDEKQFPIHSENPRSVLTGFYNLFRKDPEAVSRIINDRRIRRTAEDYLHKKFPKLNSNNLDITLEGEHGEVYREVYENDSVKPGTKLWELIRASIDPNIVDPNLLSSNLAGRIRKMESSVYKTLDDLVEGVVDGNGKVLIFTDLKQGVVNNLMERYENYGALAVNADVSSKSSNGELSKREKVRRKFQSDPENRVLIATTVMDEGVDLTAATDVVNLTLPYMPATVDQRVRRAQRIGEVEKDEVNVHTVMPRVSYGVPVITEGIAKLLDDKRRIIMYIEKEPLSLTRRDLEEIKNGNAHHSKHLTPIIKSPMQSVVSHFGQLKGQGSKKIAAHYEKYPEEAEYIARLYTSNWDGHYGGNTAKLYGKIINLLEEPLGLENKLDIASGPFSLSRQIQQPVTNLDINQHMINAGRLLEEQGEIPKGNVAEQGSFHDLPFDPESFDLSVCSLALHMSKPQTGSGRKKINEREQVFREMNRVLRPGGYGIVTLPHPVIRESEFSGFYDSLNHLGFEVLPFSGFYRGEKDSSFRVYLAALKKVSSSNDDPLDPEQLQWKMDEKLGQKTRRSNKERKGALPKQRKTEKEFVNEFYHTRSRMTLDEMVAEEIENGQKKN